MRSLQEHISDPYPGTTDITGEQVEGCAGGSCGVIAHIYCTVDVSGTISDVTYRVRGRDVALATASALCEAAIGQPLWRAAGLGLTTLHPDFAQMDEEQYERARVIEDAFHHMLGNSLLEGIRDGQEWTSGVSHVVAMSGGVDSAVALHDTLDRVGNAAVTGATLRLWIDPKAPDPEAACCAPDSVRRARATCHAAGVPHFSIDLRDEFARDVVAPFIADYRAGQTPNPCVRCNGKFRLDRLVHLADVLGAGRVVTGHYVQTVERDGQTLLQRGVDSRKDQSYMLATTSPEIIRRYEFPLGHTTKVENRKRATALGLAQATAPESQEICFLGGGDYREFLQRMEAMGASGRITTIDGTEVGTHDGIARFTPGQRRGLDMVNRRGLSNDPLYVVDVDPTSGDVTVGTRADLTAPTITLHDARLHVPEGTRVLVKTRYRSLEQAGTVHTADDGTLNIHFEVPVEAPAPGQLACLYDDDGIVVGSGTIAHRQRVIAPV